MDDQVTLEDILVNKENRYIERGDLLNKLPNNSLKLGVAVSLNIPGNVKDKTMYREIFDLFITKIENELVSNQINVYYKKISYNNTGPEGLIIVKCEKKNLKRIMIDIENNSPLGRIVDIDIYLPNNIQFSRSHLNEKNRKCILCSDDAVVCVRSQKHTIKDVLTSIENLIRKNLGC